MAQSPLVQDDDEDDVETLKDHLLAENESGFGEDNFVFRA